MAVEVLREGESIYSTMYRIQRNDMTSDAGLSGAIDDLHAAFEKFLEDQADGQAHYFKYEFYEGEEPFYGVLEPQKDELDICYGTVIAFHASWIASDALRPRLRKWFERMETALSAAHADGGDTIWESDEVQLGQTILAMLAVSDVSNVPYYTRFTALWDLDHETTQFAETEAIIGAHGICEETERLLYCRVVENIGQWGSEVLAKFLPELDAHYGDFSKSLLFRSIVVDYHTAGWECDEFYEDRLNTAAAAIIAKLPVRTVKA